MPNGKLPAHGDVRIKIRTTHPILLKESIMTEKEWMEEVKERLEQEESFLKKKIFFSTGKKVSYSFEILNYKDDE